MKTANDGGAPLETELIGPPPTPTPTLPESLNCCCVVLDSRHTDNLHSDEGRRFYVLLFSRSHHHRAVQLSSYRVNQPIKRTALMLQ